MAESECRLYLVRFMKENQMRKRRFINQHAIVFACILLINLCFFGALCIWGDPLFATNDDFRMRLIVSGRYSGVPNQQTVFLHIVLGKTLAFLYSVSPSTEWYGLLFEGCMFLSVCFVEYQFIKRAKGKSLVLRIVLLVIFSLLILQKQILMPQFTTVSAFLIGASAAGVIEYYQKKNYKERGTIGYFIAALAFSLLSCLIRGKVTLMFLPVLLFVPAAGCIYRFVSGTAPIVSDSVKKTILLTGTCVLTVLALRAVHFINLHTNPMKDYYEFTSARSSVYDYDGFPDYESNTTFYDSIGMSEVEYIALSNRTYDIEIASAETFNAVADYAKSIESGLPRWKDMAKKIYSMVGVMISSEVRSSFFCFLIISAFTLYYSKNRNFAVSRIIVPSLFLYSLAVCCLLALIGRFLARLAEASFLFGAFMMLACCAVPEYDLKEYSFKKNIIRWLSAVLIIGILFLANQYSLQGEKGTIRPNTKIKTEQLQTLRDYAAQNPDNFYFYNATDFIASTEYVFNHSDLQENMDSLGTWYCRSPLYYSRNAQYGISDPIGAIIDNPNVFYVEIGGYHATITGLIKERGYKLELAEKIPAADDVLIKIYRVIVRE